MRSALRKFPKSVGLHVELGNLHLERAEQQFRRAIRAAPDDAAAHAALGNALKEQEKPEDAIAAYRRALELAPGAPVILFNLGIALRETGELEDAVAAYDEALATAPDFAPLWYNRANALSYLGDQNAAIASFDEALARRPDYTEARFSKSVSLLLDGSFADGWDLHEGRFAARGFDTPDRSADFPRWNGQELRDRTVVVWGEQGIGDEIRFLSCLPDLVSRAGKVVYDCAPRLETLVRRSFPAVEVRPSAPKAQTVAGPGDYHLPVGSLPRHFRRSLAAFGAPRPILIADPGRVVRWRTWLNSLGPGRTVGISWRSGSRGTRKRLRYAPLHDWRPLLQSAGRHFVCLQYDDCAAEIDEIARDFGVTVHIPPDLDRRDDFEGLAALDAALDAVVTCPNTVGDLAGAIGTPTAVVEHGPHWPWGIWREAGEQGQMWYPNLTMISARDVGGWEAAFAAADAWLDRIG